MKFTYITSALLAALATAAPLTNEDKFAVDYAGGNVTGEAAPELISSVSARSLQKRANIQFVVYDSNNCGGNGLVITATGSGTKGDFPTKHSVRILQLTNGWHLSLYTGLQQSGVLTRFFATEVGADKCFVGSWQSYGLFSS
ncbi:uncharacterized protein N0V89_003297 [Didymosphaeria variabile]|uniref:Uncharacterized protein n=1 Tax=Didymosphaeria variabile TaxID=1932322 RepID=A0A9W8XVU5_9PLEO|nr:uncharacterized protein N0V89_003297 [Didymosphaeria variabile]KAJ4358713.1 hypothetical protein N0V89_003297 [Didymosphaeria variabile]